MAKHLVVSAKDLKMSGIYYFKLIKNYVNTKEI